MNDMLQDVRNKFCEEEVNRRHEVFLSDINLYLFKKNPSLQEAEVIIPKRENRSVLDYCGVRLMGETQDIVQDTLTSMIVTFDSQETCDM